MRKLLVGLGALLIVAVAAAVVLVVWLRSRPLNTPRSVEVAYLADWQAQHWQSMASLVASPPADFTRVYTQMLKALDAQAITLTPGALSTAGSTAQAGFSVTVQIKAVGTWAYQGTLHLAERQRRWKVVWAPDTVEPQLHAGQIFGLHLTWALRAPILGRNGAVLQGSAPVVTIGVEPAAITNLPAVLAAFQQYLNVPTATVTQILHQPGVQPTWFLPVTQVQPARFAALRPQLSPVPGILFEKTSARQASDPELGTVLGITGPVTAERLAQLGSPYTSADIVGLSGLEAVFEHQLAGTPTAEVELQPSPVTQTASGAPAPSSPAAPVVLDTFPGTAAQPLQTTLDPAVQAAAESAMAGVTATTNAALVAVDAATGEIRGIVNRPVGGFDRALEGAYPPGSTFKIVTTEALLTKGLTPSSPIGCPKQRVIDGRAFKNFEGEAFGPIDLATAFAQSCNTAYVKMASALSGAEFLKAADLFGFNAPDHLPLPTSLSSVPPPKDLADQVAASIGQAEDLVSPVHMAEVAAAVASGAYHPPVLVAGTTTTATPLDPTVAMNLRTLMGLVVTQGTGTAANLPGTPVYGKTGTAEFGNANPPQAHAWFVGFRGNIAFAVIVEGGGVGGQVAAPLAAKFLSALPAS